MSNFLSPAASPADADAAFFALVEAPSTEGLVTIQGDLGFFATPSVGKNVYFLLQKPIDGSPIFIGNELQDPDGRLAVVTGSDGTFTVSLPVPPSNTYWLCRPSGITAFGIDVSESDIGETVQLRDILREVVATL